MGASAQLRRARAAAFVGLCGAIALVGVELPFGELLHQRGALGAVSSELARVEAGNRQLATDVAALNDRSTIAAIAHEEYGLVRPGQRSYVVLPSRTVTAGAANTLAVRPIPTSDLVPVDAASLLASAPAPRAADGTAAGGSLWSRIVDRLAFWRWAF